MSLQPGFSQRHHNHIFDWSSSFSGRRRSGETSIILSESYQKWRTGVYWIQRPANVGPYIFSEAAYQPQNHEPRVESSWRLLILGRRRVTKTQHYCHSCSSEHILLLCFFLATGGVLIILMFWWNPLNYPDPRIKRFWIGTNSMSSCIHLYWWYLLKARVNLIWDTQCAWLRRAYL